MKRIATTCDIVARCHNPGQMVSFSVRRCPATVAITDEAAVPVAYKSLSITLPALTWEALLDSLNIEARTKLLDEVRRPDSSVSKTLLKAAIEADAPDWKERLKEEGALPVSVASVPGAALVAGGLSLVRKWKKIPPKRVAEPVWCATPARKAVKWT